MGGEYCPNGWIGSPMHSAWGSSLRDGSGGIGWSSSSSESENPSVGDNEDDDDNNNDVWLESATKQLSVLSKLPDICASDIRESREITRQKVNEEIVRQKLLRTSRETCLPCNGTWPYCDCGGNTPENFTALHFKHVVREHDEAVHVEGGDGKGADFTLPRKTAISDMWDHGQPRKKAGDSCSDAKECASDSCVRSSGGDQSLARKGGSRVCCHAQLRHCSEHGQCVDEGTACRCDKGYGGDDCGEQVEEDPLNKFKGLLGDLDDDS